MNKRLNLNSIKISELNNDVQILQNNRNIYCESNSTILEKADDLEKFEAINLSLEDKNRRNEIVGN